MVWGSDRKVTVAPNRTLMFNGIGGDVAGRGLMKDNLKPGWLIRAINMIF